LTVRYDQKADLNLAFLSPGYAFIRWLALHR
jgi:hypothetical protein